MNNIVCLTCEAYDECRKIMLPALRKASSIYMFPNEPCFIDYNMICITARNNYKNKYKLE